MMNLSPSWVLMKYAECFHHIISTKCMSAVSMFTRAVAKGWPCFFQWKRGRNNLRFFTQVASDRSSLAHRTRFGGRLASSWPCLYPWWCKTLANLIGFDRCIIRVSHPDRILIHSLINYVPDAEPVHLPSHPTPQDWTTFTWDTSSCRLPCKACKQLRFLENL